LANCRPTRSSDNHERLLQLSADVMIDYRKTMWGKSRFGKQMVKVPPRSILKAPI
jgi:hypothetical protein